MQFIIVTTMTIFALIAIAICIAVALFIVWLIADFIRVCYISSNHRTLSQAYDDYNPQHDKHK